MAEGLVGGEGFAVDASLIKADANRQRGVAPRAGDSEADLEPRGRGVSGGARRRRLRGATPVQPKFISPADPAARWTAANDGRPSTPIPPTT